MTRSQETMLRRLARAPLGDWKLRGSQRAMLRRMERNGWICRTPTEGGHYRWRIDGLGEDALAARFTDDDEFMGHPI